VTGRTVIDADEFEEARRDPRLHAFLKAAEAYMRRVDPQAAERAWERAWEEWLGGRQTRP
jgi:hypothetical protein